MDNLDHFRKVSEKQGPLFYTVKEAANRLNVSEKTIRRWIDRRLLSPSKALEGKKLIPRNQVENFYERAEKLLGSWFELSAASIGITFAPWYCVLNETLFAMCTECSCLKCA